MTFPSYVLLAHLKVYYFRSDFPHFTARNLQPQIRIANQRTATATLTSATTTPSESTTTMTSIGETATIGATEATTSTTQATTEVPQAAPTTLSCSSAPVEQDHERSERFFQYDIS